jgi:ABC-type antimicrobial peptide transport system permease subunit
MAIVLGVAMISGTYVLTDTMNKSFKGVFDKIYQGTDAVVTGHSAIKLNSNEGGGTTPSFSQSLLPKALALKDVETAVGNVGGLAEIINKDNEVIAFGGAPNLGFSISHLDKSFNVLTLASGAWPKPGQVVIDQQAASKGGYHVGDIVGIQGEGPVQKMQLSGIVKFGSANGIGGATLAGFDLKTAQQLFDKQGKLDSIQIKAKPGVSPEQLAAEVRRAMPSSVTVRTGQAEAAKQSSDTTAFITFFQDFLLAFAGIALFVGSFVIANSLSITIAQRTREFATLRTLGASRRQVLTSIVIESAFVGALASAVGLLLGFGLAKLLSWLFDRIGFTLPHTGTVIATRTIVVALVVGIVVTLIASIRPAIRATRVPPVAAVREGAQLPPSRFHRFRFPASVALSVLGFALLLYGLFAHGLTTKQILLSLGGGAVIIFLGVAILAARFARPLASLVHPVAVGAVVFLNDLVFPFFSLPFWLLRYGAFARASATRRIGALAAGTILNPLIALVVLAMWVRTKRLGAFVVGGVYVPILFSLSLISDSVKAYFAEWRHKRHWRPEWPVEPPTLFGFWLIRYGAFAPAPRRKRVLALIGGTIVYPPIALVVLVMWLRRKARTRASWPVSTPADRTINGIALHNAKRNPQRTASTASALMIGIAIVTLVAVLASSITTSFRGAVDALFTGDYAITAQNNYSPLPVSVADAAAKTPGVVAIASVRAGQGAAFGKSIMVTATAGQSAELLKLDWTQGSQRVFSELGSTGAIVDNGYAKSYNLQVGFPIYVLTPTGKSLALKVAGIFKPPTGGSPFGPVTFSAALFDRSYQNPQNIYTLVKMRGGETAANTDALNKALARFPNAKPQDRAQFIDNQTSGLNTILNVLYILLAFSVVISLFGIVNTLVLTVFERTRELGLLRAVGTTRRQARRLIRHESVITALIGGALGIALGLVFGALLVERVPLVSFSLPIGELVVFAIAAVIVGIVAAIYPARRAARLNVLEALQYE